MISADKNGEESHHPGTLQVNSRKAWAETDGRDYSA